MRVNQVSFGKIVKVNAPFDVAKQIEEIANGRKAKSTKLDSDVKNLFNDTEKGEAHTFRYDKRVSFIFSGEEGTKYWNSHNDALNNIRDIKAKTRDRFKARDKAQKAWAAHRSYVYKLINNCGISRTVDPSIQKGKIRNLDCSV